MSKSISVKKYFSKDSYPKRIYIIYILALIFWFIFCYNKALKGGDFDVYLDAAQKLTEGKNIYAPPFAKGLQYYYSVAFALFLSLFVQIPVWCKFIWLLFSSWCIYRSWRIALFFLEPKKYLSEKSFNTWCFVLALLAIRFALYNFLALQLTLFLLWACLESVYQSYNNRPYLGGTLLGIAINIKLLPLVIIPYLIYRTWYKTALFALLVMVLLLFLPIVFIGNDANAFLLAEWWSTINPTSSENSIKTNKLMHSLAAVIPAYFMNAIDGFDGARNIMSLSEDSVKLLINFLRFFLISFTLFFLKWPPFKKTLSKQQLWWEMSYILLIVPLIFPHQQKYSFWFILPAIAYITIIVFIQKDKRHYYFKLFFAFLLLLISPIIGRDILGDHIYDLFQYYKVLSLVTFFLLFFLAFLRPPVGSTPLDNFEEHYPDN